MLYNFRNEEEFKNWCKKRKYLYKLIKKGNKYTFYEYEITELVGRQVYQYNIYVQYR